jgi:hypothetical protein
MLEANANPPNPRGDDSSRSEGPQKVRSTAKITCPTFLNPAIAGFPVPGGRQEGSHAGSSSEAGPAVFLQGTSR